MTPELHAKLARIQRYATAYEVTMAHPDGRRLLVAYTPRKSRTGLWNAVVQNDARRGVIIALAGTAEAVFARKASDGLALGEWTIKFSGRTEREAYIEGELTHVVDHTQETSR